MVLSTIARMLRCKAKSPTLPTLEIASLLPLMLSLSQVVSSGVSRSRCVADGMVSRGTRRLQEVRTAAPRLLASVEQLVPDDIPVRLRYTAEEIVLIRALIEFFLGWALRLLGQITGPRMADSFPRPRRLESFYDLVLPLDSKRRGTLKCPMPA